jgi:hypothetical protein
MRRKSRPLRVLDFDCEARPLGWYGGDLTHKEVTVIAWSWIPGVPEAKARTKDERSLVWMLRAFRRVYDAADMVTGHYIRAFDLPLLNAAMVEVGEPVLGPKLSHDTKLDLVKLHGVSKSQENLAAMFDIDGKRHMTTQDWRRANRLVDVDTGVERAVMDVSQHIRFRQALIEKGLLGPPKVWRP